MSENTQVKRKLESDDVVVGSKRQKINKEEFVELSGFPAKPNVPEDEEPCEINPKVYSSRKWHNGTDNSESFTFMTYNILTPKYALTAKHNSCSKFKRTWEYRWERILMQIVIHDPDIFCLHEVDSKFFKESIQPALSELRYSIVQYTRACRGNQDFARVTCIFAKGDDWDVKQNKVLFLDSMASKYLSSYPALSYSLNHLRNTALLVELENTKTKEKLCVSSAHIHWDPRNPDWKAMQAYVLMTGIQDTIHKWGYESGNCRLLIGIDLNTMPLQTEPDEFRPTIPEGGLVGGAYQFMTSGNLPDDHIDHPHSTKEFMFRDKKLMPLAHDIPLTSSHLECEGKEPLFTTKCTDFVGCLDYIFYSKNVLKCIDVLEMPYKNDETAKSFPCIPDKDYPSDHLPIVAKFEAF